MSDVDGGGGVGDESVGDGGAKGAEGRKGRKEAPLYWRVCVCVYTTSKNVNVKKMKQKAVNYECVLG